MNFLKYSPYIYNFVDTWTLIFSDASMTKYWNIKSIKASKFDTFHSLFSNDKEHFVSLFLYYFNWWFRIRNMGQKSFKIAVPESQIKWFSLYGLTFGSINKIICNNIIHYFNNDSKKLKTKFKIFVFKIFSFLQIK